MGCKLGALNMYLDGRGFLVEQLMEEARFAKKNMGSGL